MPYDEMLSWVLFNRSIFDFEKLPHVDVFDPGGLVRSQFLQSANGDVRLPLNAPHQGHSLTAHFLADYMDAGVRHTAFATDDIFAAASAFRANAMTMLQLPDNYYDDLDARFDLPGELLERLRANQALYDRDATGEYFQVYTHNVAGWLFLEVVERRNYGGFGATYRKVDGSDASATHCCIAMLELTNLISCEATWQKSSAYQHCTMLLDISRLLLHRFWDRSGKTCTSASGAFSRF